MKIGVLRECHPGEHRVALIPAHVKTLQNAGHEVFIEERAGAASSFADEEYRRNGAQVLGDRAEVLAAVEVLLTVRFGSASQSETTAADIASMRPGQIVIGFLDPYDHETEAMKALRGRGVTAFALELLPRITRAQSMDALSAMANLAGYRAALIAAERLPRVLPMMMTAAGTIIPAKFFVIGAGVAGLQAIATAGRLGAVVSAYDVRSAVKEQVKSLGARFVEIEVPEAESDGEAEDGYAKEMDEAFYRAQREKMTSVIADSDAVITTAAVPGKPAPRLVTREMVDGMKPGSVVVDLAAERGGNCELTRPGKTVDHDGVQIVGPLNLAASLPFTASQLYSKNITTLLDALIGEDGQPMLDSDDEILQATMVLRDGELAAQQPAES